MYRICPPDKEFAAQFYSFTIIATFAARCILLNFTALIGWCTQMLKASENVRLSVPFELRTDDEGDDNDSN